jgi:hypothetical protein
MLGGIQPMSSPRMNGMLGFCGLNRAVNTAKVLRPGTLFEAGLVRVRRFVPLIDLVTRT